jgi:hypothetical protein
MLDCKLSLETHLLLTRLDVILTNFEEGNERFARFHHGISAIEKCFHWRYYRLLSKASVSLKEKLQIPPVKQR